MFARDVLWWLAACLVVLIGSAAGVLADGDPVTNDDLVRQMRSIWAKTIGQGRPTAEKRGGDTQTHQAAAGADAPWDADARSFIEGCTGRLAGIYPASVETDSPADLERMGRELLAAGCNEPIIHLLYGNILYEQGMEGEALPYLQSGYENALATPNLQLLLGAAAIRIAECMDAFREDSQANSFRHWALIDMAEAAGNPMYTEDDQSALLEIINHYCFEGLSLERKGRLVRRCVGQPDSREWLCKMLAGLLHLDVVAKTHDRYAHDMAGYDPDRSAAEAERLLRAAWELRPERPQSAAALVELDAYTHSVSGTAKEWFDRAAAAQVDYVPAYDAYILYRTRLGYGYRDIDELVQSFGRMFLAGAAYDTIVPYYYLVAISRAADIDYYTSRSRDPDLPGRADVSAGLAKMMDGYDGADISGDLRRRVQLAGAAVSSLSGDWKRARAYLDGIEDLPAQMDLAEEIFGLLDLDATSAIAQGYAETGRSAAALAQARQEYSHRRYDTALAILTDAARANRDDAWTTVYLHHAIRHTLTTRNWMAGEWVNITPDVRLTGWRVASGEAWVDADGRIVSLPAMDNWSMLVCDRPFGDTYEIRGRVSFPNLHGAEIQSGPILGRYRTWARQQFYATLLASTGNASLWDTSYSERRSPWNTEQENAFYIQVWKQNITAYFNGRAALSSYYADDMPSGGRVSTAKIGLGSRCTSDTDQLAVFSDIQIRRITTPPVRDQFDRDDSVPFKISTYSPAYGEEPPPPLPPPEENDGDAEDGDVPGDAPSDEPDEQAEDIGQSDEQPAEANRQADEDSLFRTDLLGGTKGAAFEDTLKGPGYLIGLRMRFAKDSNARVIDSIQPIYRTPTGRRFGGRVGLGHGPAVDVVARDGYAVGALVCSGADAPGGLQVVFMRVSPAGRLDADDCYRSRWYGPNTGDLQAAVGGRLTVGLAGRMGASLQAVGLIATDEPAAAGLDIPTGDGGPPAALVPRVPRDLLEFEGHYYRIFHAALPWRQAARYCRAMGGHLVKIDSQAENNLVTALSGNRKRPVWIGAHRDQAGQWLWSEGEELTFANWRGGHPDGNEAAAAAIGVDTTTRWINVREGVWASFVCEWDSDPRPPADTPAGVLPRAVEHQGHWYREFCDPVTGRVAQAMCQAMGGNLVIIDTEAENQFVRSLPGSTWVFIGAVADRQGDWHWLDGGELTYANWYPGQPDNDSGDEFTAVMNTRTGQWDDVAPAWRPERWTHGFICEWNNPPAPDVLAAARQVLCPPAPGETADQPADDQYIPFGGHWYKASYAPVTWQDARAQCQALGGHLLYIDDQQEDAFAMLFVTFDMPHLWIGATDQAEEDHWLWTDGAELTYANWGPDEPNNMGGAEDAAVLTSYGWNDLAGEALRGFICEWDHDPTAPPEAADEGAAP